MSLSFPVGGFLVATLQARVPRFRPSPICRPSIAARLQIMDQTDFFLDNAIDHILKIPPRAAGNVFDIALELSVKIDGKTQLSVFLVESPALPLLHGLPLSYSFNSFFVALRAEKMRMLALCSVTSPNVWQTTRSRRD